MAEGPPRTKVLFVAEAVTLAHVVRLVTLAGEAQRRGSDVVLATDGRYAPLVGALPFPTVAITTMPPARFQHAISTGAPIFDLPTLQACVREDLQLLARIAPRIVVGDFRLSLSVSARVARVPFVNLTNAYWSPLARIRRIVPEFAWVRRVGPTLAQPMFRAFERVGLAVHAAPVNRLRRQHGMPSIGHDFRSALVDGDLTCFADVPEVVPTAPLPKGQLFIGPVPWEPALARPPWWATVCESERRRPLVYVSLGSSGPRSVLQGVLDGLAGLPLDAIVSTAGRAETLRVPANAHVAELLPGDQACAAADLVIGNGGSPGTYQALARGKPVVGLATNMDQFLNMGAVEDAGCGRLLRSGAAGAAAVRKTVMDVLASPAMADSARALAQTLSGTPAAERFVGLLNGPWPP